MKTVLGIDNGTQSTKVLVYDFEKKTIRAEAQSPHDLISKNDGTREQKAEWWIDALDSCMKKIEPSLKKTVVAVGVSGQQHGFVPLDGAGKVLYNVKLWCDTATADECAEITRAYGGEKKLLSKVGNLILPGYTAPKILWLKKHQRKAYDRLATILLPHDYLNFYLTGNRVMEYGDASGTALLDIRKRIWRKDLIKVLDPERDLLGCLPKLIGPDQPAGTLLPSIAEKYGLPTGILVSSGGGDNMMGAIGTGTTRNGVLTMSLGTSGTFYGYSDTPIIDPEGNLAAFCSSSGGWLPLLCTMNCTVAQELVRDLFETDIPTLEKLIKEAPIGSEGIVMLPFFNGERTPNLPKGRGCIMGMTMANFTKKNVMRSAMEAAIFGMKLGYDSFSSLGFKAKEIRLIGGGAKSANFRQITADVLNLPIVVPEIGEAAALGAALQALWSYETREKGSSSLDRIVDDHVKLKANQKHTPNPK
ncbi:MAG TPA: xylulokinase, partial [Spirochaetia bacterium]|nr:xylulokinase [Spirochaetia bacterium]